MLKRLVVRLFPTSSARPHVVVVGDRRFAMKARRLASESGRRVVGVIRPGALRELSDSHQRVDEVAVQGTAIKFVGEIPQWMRSRGAAVFVTPTGSADELFKSPDAGWNGRAKRVIDVFAALFGLVIFLPIVVAAGLAVRRDGPGPLFFTQERAGRSGRPFRLYKLRTMVAGNDNAEHREYVASLIRGEGASHDGMFKLTNDRRVTRSGRILRRFSLDEVPQLYNVLRGDMSLVGPRPALPHEVELYDSVAAQRLRVKPGLTGLWQVSGRCELPFPEMVRLDIEYQKGWTVARDLSILARTPRAVVSGKGAA